MTNAEYIYRAFKGWCPGSEFFNPKEFAKWLGANGLIDSVLVEEHKVSVMESEFKE